MRRRLFFLSLPAIALANETRESVRGRLVNSGEPYLELPDGRKVKIDGDEEVRLVLRDKRLTGVDFEMMGRKSGGDQFVASEIHTRPLFVHKGGKRLYVTYWCDVCAIRTNSPGICWCCREETELDLRENPTS